MMQDSDQTKKQHKDELVALRIRLHQLESKQVEAKKIEDALASAHRRLNHMLSASPAMLYSCQAHGEYAATYVSDNVERILGYTPLQFTQEPNFWLDHIHDDDRDRVLDKLHLLAEKDIHTHEYRFRCADGSYRWLYDELQLIRDENRQPVEIVGSMIDITELKQVEEEVRRAHREWENIFQGIGQSAMILDEHYTILEVNRATAQALGQPAQDLIGRKCYELFHQADAPAECCPLATMLQSGHHETVEMEIETLGGVFLVSCTPIFDEKGNLQKIIHIATDVSDRKKAEEALRRERDFNKRLIQASPAFIVSISPEGKTLMMNDAMLNALGYTAQEVSGKDYLSTFVPQADREMLAAIFSQLVRQKVPTVNENRVVTKDGRELMVLWHGRQIFDEYGNVEYFFGVGIDITERKQTEEELRASEERFKMLSESSPMGVFETDRKGRVLYLNDRWCSIAGMRREDALGTGWSRALHPEDKSWVIEKWAKCVSEGKGYAGEFRFCLPTGEIRWVFTRTSPIISAAGEIIGHVGANEDVTERKRVEEALRFTQFSIDHTTESAFWVDPDAHFVYVNEAACRSLGYMRDELLSMTVYDIDPSMSPKAWAVHWQDLKTRRSFTLTSTHRKRSGEMFPVEITVNYLEYHGREYNFAFARDITDRKRAEMSLRMAEVGKLASGLVHEVRNPLNAMRMQIAVIRNKLMVPDSQNLDMAVIQLERLEHEVLRVQELANDFLSYGRPASDRPETIELTRVVKDIAEFIRPEFEQNGIHVQVLCYEDLGPLNVRMDLSKLRQVLLNLAENGRQAMDRGGQLKFICDKTSPHEARIQVQDTGCGIPPDQLARVFDAFYSTKGEGTGLGLAIVRRTVEAAGGYVNMTSEVGQGTCFEIYLPLVPEDFSTLNGAEVER